METDVLRILFPSPGFLVGPGSWAKGEEDLPAPSDLPLLHFPPLLPLHFSRFVPHLNLESELIVPHTYLTHPLTPSNPEPVMEGVS